MKQESDQQAQANAAIEKLRESFGTRLHALGHEFEGEVAKEFGADYVLIANFAMIHALIEQAGLLTGAVEGYRMQDIQEMVPVSDLVAPAAINQYMSNRLTMLIDRGVTKFDPIEKINFVFNENAAIKETDGPYGAHMDSH